MKQSELPHYLDEADQSVKNFIASLLEIFSSQLKQEDDPLIAFEYFGAVIEVRLLSFDGVYDVREEKREVC
ncbi:hypothetical protein P4S72_15465 [Vibrio sp. PP-XX7]